MLDKKDKRIFHKKIKDLTNEEKDFIKSYTTNNIYMLHGLYNGPNIFNNYTKYYFTNTLELFIFISSNTKLIVSIINSFLDVIFILLIILIIILYFLY